MACFLVPMALAIVTSLIQKTARSLAEKIKLWILNVLLWGGVILLAVEHVWHGEVVPWPPFLTAMANPADVPVMIHEMLTVGIPMSVVTLAAWGTMLALSRYMPRMMLRTTAHVEKPLTPR
ncbi:MAG: hypothetical protein B9J98_02295 [Candidatus Terraquivivens tikiterensis]|uniref:Uncharacterized protein n=1 Tax=Candidatus Terraquivivens tikiterensis TaxID=1980982 RepID=A0A2R7Y8C8_9ARCH|nr:MAG: hypothetical protein B9J98_02295 [Candidatus Terraquivivens tikiterensis]